MDRRAFIAGTLALLAAPPAAEAQPAAKVPRLGLLMPGRPEFASSSGPMEALRQGLRDLGWVEGRTITFEPRWDEGRPERWPELAADLVRRQVDVIFAGTTAGAVAARDATREIPIVAGLTRQGLDLQFTR